MLSVPTPFGLVHNALTLSHGVTFNPDDIGIIYDPVTDGVSQSRVIQVLMPARNIELRAENGRGCFGSASTSSSISLASLSFSGYRSHSSKISSFVFFSFFMYSGRFRHPEPWQSPPTNLAGDVLCVVEVPVRRHAQCTCQIGLSRTSCAQQDHIMCFLNVGTGCQPQNLETCPASCPADIQYLPPLGPGNGITSILYEAL